MSYEKTSDLPDAVKKLPEHGQDIYLKAFNAAFVQYQQDETKAHAAAWSAVEKVYKKDDKGEWVMQEAAGMSDEDKRRLLQGAIEQKFTIASQPPAASPSGAWVRDVYDTELVYEQGGQSYKVSYTLDAANKVIFGEPVKVVAVTIYKATEAGYKVLESFKTEDGEEFPPEAFAYAPDKERPSTWKLRLWESIEKKVTRPQLGKAAAALSPGGYRGQKVEIIKESLPEVKRRIRAAYLDLQTPETEIPRWVIETDMKRTLVTEFIPLTEATVTGKGKGTAVIIKPGFNSSKSRYYPIEMLARDYKIFEKAKMFADHPSEADERNRPERSIRDWVAVLENVRNQK